MKIAIGITIGCILMWLANGDLIQKGILYNQMYQENKHIKEQLIKANSQVEEWNKNFMATDYAKRNGIKYLRVTENHSAGLNKLK